MQRAYYINLHSKILIYLINQSVINVGGMIMDNEVKELLENLGILRDMYDDVRIVNPLKKKVVSKKDGQIIETDYTCYDFWGTGEICMNCISMRAHNDDKTYIKIEREANNIFMVTAIPICIENVRYVVETMKNVTKNMFYIEKGNAQEIEIYELIKGMNKMAHTDALTEVYNRRFIDERLPVELIKTIQKNSKLSLIMADIDFFKKVNDNYGHLAGDHVLKAFAKRLNGCLRNSKDWVARYGGEEFLICLLDADISEAYKVAERMRCEVESMIIKYNDLNLKVTASFGVAATSENNNSYKGLLESADAKLYESKNSGRNKVSY